MATDQLAGLLRAPRTALIGLRNRRRTHVTLDRPARAGSATGADGPWRRWPAGHAWVRVAAPVRPSSLIAHSRISTLRTLPLIVMGKDPTVAT
jgi:hypothetical protein